MQPEIFVIDMDGKEITAIYTPNNESPLRQVDTGTMTLKDGDELIGDYLCKKTSFVPFPAAFIKK